jgi:two-component system, OmpR family, phosphate regulon sensor histidine kinase PhoR
MKELRPKSPSDPNLKKFAETIECRKEQVLLDWRQQVRRLPAARNLDVPTLNDHVPPLLDELTEALAVGEYQSLLDLQLENSPKIHGSERLRAGFDVVEVVAEYNILREILLALADTEGLDIAGSPNRILNRVVDRAIALAVDTFAKERALEIQQRREEQLSYVMHDLRTPLTAIQTAGSILTSSLSPEAKTNRVTQMIDVLKRNTARLNALLKAASQEQYNIATSTLDEVRADRRCFGLSPLVEGLIHDLSPLAENAPVQIVNVVPEDLVVFADALLMTQVLQNLLSNAIKYTEAGHIVVGAEKKPDGTVRCWVSDTGRGIPAERLGKIFEKLESDPDWKGGLGLGLAIVKQIVAAHGGQVFVDSEPGRGSTFSFTITQPLIP